MARVGIGKALRLLVLAQGFYPVERFFDPPPTALEINLAPETSGPG